jgi:hypothetical protein
MADENEDQWLYGDSADAKEYTPANVQTDIPQNDSIPDKIQEKVQSQEDEIVEGINEIPSEVR